MTISRPDEVGLLLPSLSYLSYCEAPHRDNCQYIDTYLSLRGASQSASGLL